MIGEDIVEGKRAMVLIHLLAHCTATEHARIVQIYTKHVKTPQDVQYVWHLIQQYESIDYAQQRGEVLVEKAKAIFNANLAELLQENIATTCLAQAMEWVIHRTK